MSCRFKGPTIDSIECRSEAVATDSLNLREPSFDAVVPAGGQVAESPPTIRSGLSVSVAYPVSHTSFVTDRMLKPSLTRCHHREWNDDGIPVSSD